MTISAKDYAGKIGYSPAAVTKRLKNQSPPYSLPYTTSVKKFGNMWLIELTNPFPAKKAAKEFKENFVNSN